jgi:hypothetical protein
MAYMKETALEWKNFDWLDEKKVDQMVVHLDV